MKSSLRRVLEGLNPGDLICCSWCDASIGKSSGSGAAIDVPVRSWGVYVGLFGEKTKHIVLAQNSFRYADGLYDLDYTAIPLSWTVDIQVLAKAHVPNDVADKLVSSFLLGRRRVSHFRTLQVRLTTHG